ncbi:SDR family oxidoreductase [Marinomonas sp. 15G1-11]|uniref:SDR family oxidoreductase n=1 Tax=Marinomonas phaeophyticola TaxID=3004091 RepID=A0ABT4JSX3_9GAMM|nr:SDR family oxidoreductase [Marinomonas sp. 15G1-11]MCZ2721408.1 SDR family oxidoreductase [Marinomonas sp. 15G1-11]
MSAKKVVIITGGSRGIGAEAAKLFARNGYAVCINYVRNVMAAKKVQQDILDMGGECIIVQADVSKADEVEFLFQAVDNTWGSLSVLVNNAGILKTQTRFEGISAERFMDVMRTNVLSCFLCSQQAIKRMSYRCDGRGGAIINISSKAAQTGSPNEYVDYAASKGAMDSMTRGLAMEVAAEGIRVNGVRPGLIYTEMHAAGGEAERVDRLKSKIPMQRGGEASEVAEAIVWLASEKSSFVTGTFIDTSGGL